MPMEENNKNPKWTVWDIVILIVLVLLVYWGCSALKGRTRIYKNGDPPPADWYGEEDEDADSDYAPDPAPRNPKAR